MNTQENIREIKQTLSIAIGGADVECSIHPEFDNGFYTFRIKKNGIITIVSFSGDIVDTFSIDQVSGVFNKHHLIVTIRDNIGKKIRVSSTKVTINPENF